MPFPRRQEYETAEFKRLWYSSMTMKEIAKQYSVSSVAILKAIRQRGWDEKRVINARRKTNPS